MKLFLLNLLGLSFALLTPHITLGKPADPCAAGDDTAVTLPAKVDLKILEQTVRQLTVEGTGKTIRVVDDKALRNKLTHLFEPTHPTSKLHQFFHTLHIVAENELQNVKELPTKLSPASVRAALMAGKVFPNEEFPKHITSVSMTSLPSNQYHQFEFHIGYSQNPVRLPLNQGQGFGVFRDGKCQHAQALVFYGNFSFRTRELDNGNLLVYQFNNVDIVGDFGARTWMINVDLSYVSLKEVEFIKGTNKGRVKAYVSKKEFEVTQHSWWLRQLTRIIPDNSVQVIDW